MNYLLFILPLVYAITNRVRGSLGFGGVVGGIVTGLVIAFFTQNYILAALTAGLYIAGESWGWGKWIISVPHWGDPNWTPSQILLVRTDGKNNGIHWLANKLCSQTKNFSRYAQIALALRGLWWWAPIYIAIAAFGHATIIGTVVACLLSLTFPLCYYITYNVDSVNFWGYGEILYGFIQGIALICVLFVI